MSAARLALCDWGGSRLRAYLQQDGQIVARREGPGIGVLPAPPLEVLQSALRPWREERDFAQVYICGMGGSRNGLREVPYVAAPVDLTGWLHCVARVEIECLMIAIAAGVRAEGATAPDVMRGEETQVFGALALRPDLFEEGRRVLLPGTHSKWVDVDGGRICGLQTYLTGELFALLCEHSSLLRAGQGALEGDDGFATGLRQEQARGLEASLFQTRTEQLIRDRSPRWARDFLSGVLIGGEISAALAEAPVESVIIVGDAQLNHCYARALQSRGIAVDALDGDACAIAGLRLLASYSEPA